MYVRFLAYQDSGCLVKCVLKSVHNDLALCHSPVGVVEEVRAGFGCLPALYHVSVCIVADPLADVPLVICLGFLVHVLGNCLCTVLYTVKPVPCVRTRVIDFLSTVGCVKASVSIVLGTLAYAALIPVLCAAHRVPAVYGK